MTKVTISDELFPDFFFKKMLTIRGSSRDHLGIIGGSSEGHPGFPLRPLIIRAPSGDRLARPPIIRAPSGP